MFSEPVVGEKFFGRDSVLELLNKRVTALKEGYRQNIALTGQSLAGKSSIILHFLHNIKDEGFVPIYVEVIPEEFRSFSNKFIATMLYNALAGKGEELTIEMGGLLEYAQKAFPKTYLAIKGVTSLIDRGDFDEAYSGLLGLTSVLKDETGLSCIVILDEFDNLENLGVKNPFLSFGKIIMVQKDTMYIVSSSRNEAIKKIISEKLSLLFGNFEVIKVSNFDFKTALDFIEVKAAGLDMDNRIKKFLVAFTDGNPFYLDKIMTRSREVALQAMSGYINRDIMAEAMLDLIFRSGGSIHQYLMNFILELLETKYRDYYISILVAIASKHNKQSEIARILKKKQSDLSKGLLHLTQIGLISKNGIFYKIDDAVLQFWLKFVYQRKKELLIDGVFDRMSLFKEEVIAFMAEFEKEMERDAVPRIAELFNLFSNELVQIDSKNIRLPHFTRVEIKVSSDSKPFLACSFRGSLWVVQPYEKPVDENDIIEYIKTVKSISGKIANKIIIPLRGIDENAKLLAKELRISIWGILAVNRLLAIYGRKRIIEI